MDTSATGMIDVTQADLAAAAALCKALGVDSTPEVAAQAFAAHRIAAHKAGVRLGLDAAAQAITNIQYDGRDVHDHFAEGTSAAYEAVIDLKPSDITGR